jgi:hypothetical protein
MESLGSVTLVSGTTPTFDFNNTNGTNGTFLSIYQDENSNVDITTYSAPLSPSTNTITNLSITALGSMFLNSGDTYSISLQNGGTTFGTFSTPGSNNLSIAAGTGNNVYIENNLTVGSNTNANGTIYAGSIELYDGNYPLGSFTGYPFGSFTGDVSGNLTIEAGNSNLADNNLYLQGSGQIYLNSTGGNPINLQDSSTTFGTFSPSGSNLNIDAGSGGTVYINSPVVANTTGSVPSGSLQQLYSTTFMSSILYGTSFTPPPTGIYYVVITTSIPTSGTTTYYYGTGIYDSYYSDSTNYYSTYTSNSGSPNLSYNSTYNVLDLNVASGEGKNFNIIFTPLYQP